MNRAGPLILLAFASVGCEASNGTGFVEARFSIPECPPGERKSELVRYRFEDPWMSTERYSGALIIGVQRHRVRVEEADRLAVRLELQDLIDRQDLIVDQEREQIVRGNPDPAQPLRIPLTFDGGLAQAALSLFETCPLFPTYHAISGEVSLSKLTLAEAARDTGRREVLAGTLTATVVSSVDFDRPVAEVFAAFDFQPPTRPTAEFR